MKSIIKRSLNSKQMENRTEENDVVLSVMWSTFFYGQFVGASTFFKPGNKQNRSPLLNQRAPILSYWSVTQRERDREFRFRQDSEEEGGGEMTLGGGGTSTTQAYGEKWYWDKRYGQEPGPFDWYQKYHSLAPLLRLYVQPHHRVLVVGCGNSGTCKYIE